MRIICFILLCLASPALAQIQWSEPVQLIDSVSFVGARAAINGETLHVVGNQPWVKCYYISSMDGGESWTEINTPAPIDTFYGSDRPDIIYSAGKVYMTFISYFYRAPSQVFVISSSDAGQTWSTPHQVFRLRDNHTVLNPLLAAKGDTLFLNCQMGNSSIDYLLSFRSFDAGITWRDSTVIEPEGWSSGQWPSFHYAAGILHLAYLMTSQQWDIFYRRSTDLGLTWSDRVRLSTQDGHAGQDPSAFADSSGAIVVAWYDYEHGSMCGYNGDILDKVSLDNGENFINEGRAINTHSGDKSSCLILGDIIHMVWADEWPMGCGYPKIMYSYSRDWGQTWAEPQIVSGNYRSTDRAPFLKGKSNGEDLDLYCFWDRYAPETGSGLCFAKGKFTLSAAEDDDKPEFPKQTILSAYPNPFNTSTIITVSGTTEAEIGIYDITGRRLDVLQTQDGRVVWKADERPSDVYFARVVGEKSGEGLRLVLLK